MTRAEKKFLVKLHECLGYIESLLLNESYSDVIICGDFNFPCNGHNIGYRSLLNIMTDFNLSHCDDLICNNIHESYVNVALGHASLIDHFIVNARLRQLIINCEILVLPDNFSDHRPMCVKANLPNVSRSMDGVAPG